MQQPVSLWQPLFSHLCGSRPLGYRPAAPPVPKAWAQSDPENGSGRDPARAAQHPPHGSVVDAPGENGPQPSGLSAPPQRPKERQIWRMAGLEIGSPTGWPGPRAEVYPRLAEWYYAQWLLAMTTPAGEKYSIRSGLPVGPVQPQMQQIRKGEQPLSIGPSARDGRPVPAAYGPRPYAGLQPHFRPNESPQGWER